MVSILYDFAVASLFIFVAQILRTKVVFLQKFFIPASLLAGLAALVLGDQCLNLLHWSDASGDYTWTLVILVFVAMGLPGLVFNKAQGERLGSYFFYKTAIWALQFSIPVLFACLVLSKMNLGVNDGFGLLLASGFIGGHGTAAAAGATFAKIGFPEALDIGMTFATAGILTGVFGGVIFIKIATRKGYTQYVQDFSLISDDLKTGMVKRENRDVMGRNTISSISLDPLFWHLAIMLIPTGIALWFSEWFAAKTTVVLPEYAVGFLVALIMAALLKPTGIMEYVDFRITDRIAGVCTDLIVFFGVAKIKLYIVVTYAVPLLIMVLLGITLCVTTLWYFGPRMNRKSWFERSVFCYGYCTGVFAIGMLLLRIVDPENESGTLSDNGFVEAFHTFLDLLVWAVGPYMMMNGTGLYFGLAALVLLIASIVISRVCGWWYKIPLVGREAIHDVRGD